jgi:hypothetical protein
MRRMTETIPLLKSDRNFFKDGILICWMSSQISEMFQNFEGFITYFMA